MPAHYVPNIVLEQVDPVWKTVLLSTRDVSLDIPINHKLIPGISLTTTCFSDGRYTNDKETCISNLLAFGYRLFAIDLYWHPNPSPGKWSLCPASSLPVKESRGDQQLQCSRDLDIAWIWQLWNDWIDQTNFNIFTSVCILVFDLHEDMRGSFSEGSPTVPSALNEAAVSEFPTNLYTPKRLLSDRMNLNTTWLRGGDEGDDETRYFDVVIKPDGGLESKNAWPSEGYLCFEKGERLILGIGEVAVRGFSVGRDEDYFFNARGLGWPGAGRGQPCLLKGDKAERSDVNSSWARVVDDGQNPWRTKENLLQAVDCGWSPTINTTLSSNSTVSNNYTLSQLDYLNLLHGAVWSWAQDEPATPPYNLTEEELSMFRCASMSTTTGRWKVADCNSNYHVACRIGDRPYKWTIGKRAGSYFDAMKLCPKQTTFDVPRTPLENRYLLQAASALTLSKARQKGKFNEALFMEGELDGFPPNPIVQRTSHLSGTDHIWIDLQSLRQTGCWVRGGSNGEEAECPYVDNDSERKAIVVPTVAAVIVLVMAGLMVFAKLGNRRWEKVQKRRRREARQLRKEGWQYEGVPA